MCLRASSPSQLISFLLTLELSYRLGMSLGCLPLRLRRRTAASPTRPEPRSASEAGRIGILLAGECLDVTVAVSIGIADDPSFAWFAFSC